MARVIQVARVFLFVRNQLGGMPMDAIENRIGAAYVRAGIVDKGASRSLVVQTGDVITVANERGIQIPEEYVFSEQASGADSNWPVLNQVRQLARDGKI